MKALIFSHKDGNYSKRNLFLHVDEIKRISVSIFYHESDTIIIKTKNFLYIIIDPTKQNFYQHILDFIDSDKSYEKIQLTRVTESEDQIEGTLVDWVSRAMGGES